MLHGSTRRAWLLSRQYVKNSAQMLLSGPVSAGTRQQTTGLVACWVAATCADGLIYVHTEMVGTASFPPAPKRTRAQNTQVTQPRVTRRRVSRMDTVRSLRSTVALHLISNPRTRDPALTRTMPEGRRTYGGNVIRSTVPLCHSYQVHRSRSPRRSWSTATSQRSGALQEHGQLSRQFGGGAR